MADLACFNTQPPEGGCWDYYINVAGLSFQHTAARRRLRYKRGEFVGRRDIVSTHSRPKAAGVGLRSIDGVAICFNTQPPEGGCSVLGYLRYYQAVSTHSRPKAAEHDRDNIRCYAMVSTHSRPKAAGSTHQYHAHLAKFQHTAARRRLRARLQ